MSLTSSPIAWTLEITRVPRGLRVSLAEVKDQTTWSRGFELLDVAFDEVDRLAQDLRFLLERANLFGEIGLAATDEIERLALLLFDLLMPASLKPLLRRAPEGSQLTLRLDESLQHIPWEFVHTGQDFLARQFAVGREIARYGITEPMPRRVLSTEARRLLIVCDPKDDLPASAREGRILYEALQHTPGTEVSLRAHPVSRADLREQLREHDIVHFAGHVEWDVQGSAGGWVMCDGYFGAADVDQLAGGRPMPALVFANACASAAPRAGVDHMARSFMSAGAANVIGTLWDIPDELGAVFAHSFYDALLQGVSVGEALRRARIELTYHHGEGAMLWGSYVLYGAPGACYFQPDLEFAPPTDIQHRRKQPVTRFKTFGGGAPSAIPRAAYGEGGLLAAGAGGLRSAATAQGPFLMGHTARLLRQLRVGIVVGLCALVLVGVGLFVVQPTGNAATTSQSRREATKTTKAPIPPPALTPAHLIEAPALRAELVIMAQIRDMHGQQRVMPLGQGEGLHPGENIRVLVTPKQSAYASLLYIRHDGLVQILPMREGEPVAYLLAEKEIALPGEARWFSPDHVPGPAALVLLQGRAPISDLPLLVQDLRQLIGAGAGGVLVDGGFRTLPLGAIRARLDEVVDAATVFELDLSAAN